MTTKNEDHVPAEALIDIVDGRSPGDASLHVASCPACRDQVAALQATLKSAEEAELPEPSPLYWQAFRKQVRRRIDREHSVRRAFVLGPALFAAAVLAVVFLGPGREKTTPPIADEPRVLGAWSALPATEDDSGLRVLESLTPEALVDAESAACNSWTECVLELTEEEDRALSEGLKGEMGGHS